MVGGIAVNAATAESYSRMLGKLDLTECVAALATEIRKARAGDLSGLEATLVAQAVTLNAMFTQLARQASRMTIVDQIDRFTRLALKAQSQCRTTVEALASMRNPPSTVFTRQANIAHGPQQVNNAGAPQGGDAKKPTPSAENRQTEQNEVLEAHGKRLDTGTTPAPDAGDQAVATVGALHGSTNARGQGALSTERIQRRPLASGA
jgi:hypothetical protein